MIQQWTEERAIASLSQRYVDANGFRICSMHVFPTGIAVLFHCMGMFHPRLYVDHYKDGTSLPYNDDLKCSHLGVPSRDISAAMAEYILLVASQMEKNKTRY